MKLSGPPRLARDPRGMATAFQTSLESRSFERLTPDEWIACLLEAGWNHRQNQRIRRSLANARFRYQACLPDVDHQTARNLDTGQWQRLADCSFVDRHKNLIITGATGAGKSFLASAPGHQACVKGYRVSYQNTARLLTRLKMAQADNSYSREMIRLEKQDLLILDDFGLTPIRQSLPLHPAGDDGRPPRKTLYPCRHSSFPSAAGTNSSASRPWLMPSLTGWFTPPTASNLRGNH